jgi:ribose transport system ATP-binding protein
MGEVFLTTKALTKKFGDLVAVNHVDMEVRLGEIRGLIGENGSGKSTISSMIAGIHSITSGEIYIGAERYCPTSNNDARANKIVMIVQEVGTIDGLSIADNLFIGDEKEFCNGPFLSRKKMIEAAKKALHLIGFDDVDPEAPIESLNFEQRKMVEIARALYYDPSLFIVDETTTALSQDGREMIYRIMRTLRDNNKAVLFISHDLAELMDICDALTVLRDGTLVANIEKQDFSEDRIKETMVGRKLVGNYYRSDYDPTCGERVMLRAKNVTLKSGAVRGVDLELHEGEILGIGGLSDSGMHELGKALFGMEALAEGEITAQVTRPLTKEETKRLHRVRLSNYFTLLGHKNGQKFKKKALQGGVQKEEEARALTAADIEMFRTSQAPDGVTLKTFDYPTEIIEKKITSISDAFNCSIGYIAKNRDRETLILPENIRDNICISAYDLLNIFGFILPGQEKNFTKQQIDFLRIKCTGQNQIVAELSGGNKQKVAFAKWIGNNSKILVFDSPTRGVDIGVKTTMYQLLYLLKQVGYAILIISEEMPELIGMSDRILVMKDGEVTQSFTRSADLKDTDIIKYMI